MKEQKTGVAQPLVETAQVYEGAQEHDAGMSLQQDAVSTLSASVEACPSDCAAPKGNAAKQIVEQEGFIPAVSGEIVSSESLDESALEAQGTDTSEQRLSVLLLDLGMGLDTGQMQVYLLARNLQKHDSIRVLVACPKHSALRALLDKEGIPCCPLGSSSLLNPLLVLSLAWAIRKHRVRLVHTQDEQSATAAWLIKKFFKEKLLIVHSQRILNVAYSGMSAKRYLQLDGVLCANHEIEKELAEAGISEDRIFRIQAGIDLAQYSLERALYNEHFVFLSVGQLTPQKSNTVLFQAMQVLSEMEDIPSWEMRIVDNRSLSKELLDEAKQLNIAPYLAIFAKQDSRFFLSGANAMIVLSPDTEIASLAIKEAWVAKLPVICSNLPCNLELVKDKHNGIVVPDGNPVALAVAMLRTMTEAQRVAEYADEGERTLKQNYTLNHLIDTTVTAYQQICTANKKM